MISDDIYIDDLDKHRTTIHCDGSTFSSAPHMIEIIMNMNYITNKAHVTIDHDELNYVSEVCPDDLGDNRYPEWHGPLWLCECLCSNLC